MTAECNAFIVIAHSAMSSSGWEPEEKKRSYIEEYKQVKIIKKLI